MLVLTRESQVDQLHEHNPMYNYIVCKTDHDKHWDGVEGKDWTHTEREFRESFPAGRKISKTIIIV